MSDDINSTFHFYHTENPLKKYLGAYVVRKRTTAVVIYNDKRDVIGVTESIRDMVKLIGNFKKVDFEVFDIGKLREK